MIDIRSPVNRTAYMDFKEATDGLFERVDHEALAKRLGVSVAAIRQARLREEAGAHRAPPANWRPTVIRLAEERVWHYQKLIENLRREDSENERERHGSRSAHNRAGKTDYGK
jgi:hypothetical protein